MRDRLKRQHPAALIGYTSRNFWMLIIPLIRGLVILRFDFSVWVRGLGWDGLIVLVMIAAAVIRWNYTRYFFGETAVSIETGVFYRQTTDIPYKNVSAVTTEENPFDRAVGTVRAYIDTDAATLAKRKADSNLLIKREECDRLFERLKTAFSDESGNELSVDGSRKKADYVYRVSAPVLIAFSLFFSSALSGVILLITFMYVGTDFVGGKLQNNVVSIVNGLSDAVAESVSRIIDGISPAGIGISIVIGTGFLVSFISNILRHIKFTSERYGRSIIITSGLVIKRKYCINSAKVNMADLRQNLMMKIFGMVSVHVSCTGYGKRKNEFPVFLPICTVRKGYKKKYLSTVKGSLGKLLPGFRQSDEYIRTRLFYLWRFIWPPALPVVAVPWTIFLTDVYYPEWHSLACFICIILEIPLVWLLIVKAAAYMTNGFSITEDSLCAKYCDMYEFHTVTVPRDRVAEIRVTQTIFQRMNHSCDVHIYTAQEYIRSHTVRGMPFEETTRMIRDKY